MSLFQSPPSFLGTPHYLLDSGGSGQWSLEKTDATWPCISLESSEPAPDSWMPLSGHVRVPAVKTMKPSTNITWTIYFCRLLIHWQELKFAKNHYRHILWILKSRFYFSDRCKWNETILKILCSRFCILAICWKMVESRNYAPALNKESTVHRILFEPSPTQFLKKIW